MHNEKYPVGVWGGSYDMPTTSHKQNLIDALEHIDVLYVVPSGKQNSKQPVAGPWERVRMVGLMVAEILTEHPDLVGRLRVWTGEIEECPRHYVDGVLAFDENHTIETVERIEDLLGLAGQAVICIGEDLVSAYPSWQHAGSRTVLVHERYGFENAVLQPYMIRMGSERRNSGSRYLQRAIENGEYVANCIPAAVLDLIRERGWYGYSENNDNLR